VGSICLPVPGVGLFVTVSKEKWDKGKDIIKRWHKRVIDDKDRTLPFKELEKDMGYLVHLSRTYPAMFPYFRGFYNLMNGWQSQRDDEGWKMTMREWKARLELFEDFDVEEAVESTLSGKKRGRKGKPKTQPEKIVAVPRLQEDIFALTRLFSQSTPSERLIQGTAISEARYGFGDAFKAGFRASWARTGGINTGWVFGARTKPKIRPTGENSKIWWTP